MNSGEKCYRLTAEEAEIAFEAIGAAMVRTRCDCDHDVGFVCKRCKRLEARGVDIIEHDRDVAFLYGKGVRLRRVVVGAERVAKIMERVDAMRVDFERASKGYRSSDFANWFRGVNRDGDDAQPAIMVCEHPGNLIARATFVEIATFVKEEDRDAVVAAHSLVLDLVEGRL